MSSIYRIILTVCIIVCLSSSILAQQTQQQSLILMGSAFVFSAAHVSDTLAWEAIQAGITEVQRIESLISSWNPHSQTSQINRMAGIQPVQVDWEVFMLIRRAIKVAALTDGAFDPSFAAIDRVWRFDGSMTELPSESEIAQSVEKIDYQQVILNPIDTTVYLIEKGMKIGFGAIGKGYAANQAKRIMQHAGIAHGLVNAGGDLICWGKKDAEKDWRIGIADPYGRQKIVAWLSINDLAVVTSGDYERYAMIDGIRYAHIIDPRTGFPATGLRSVSIICPDAELADALATAVFVLGEEKGFSLIEQLRGVEGILITESGKILPTENLDLEFQTSKEPLELKIGEGRRKEKRTKDEGGGGKE